VLTLVVTGLGLLPPKLMQLLLDKAIPHKDFSLLWRLCGLLLGVYLVNTLFSFARTYLMSWLGQRVLYDMRSELYQHLQRLSLSFYDNHRTGQLMSRITGDVGMLEGFLIHSIPQFFVDLLTLFGIGFVLFQTDPKLALIALAPTPLLFLMTVKYKDFVLPVYRRLRYVWGDLTSFFVGHFGRHPRREGVQSGRARSLSLPPQKLAHPQDEFAGRADLVGVFPDDGFGQHH
jgi:ABC-type bacteriocin/lantibiotic exporter with double-glycine peptidase domain